MIKIIKAGSYISLIVKELFFFFLKGRCQQLSSRGSAVSSVWRHKGSVPGAHLAQSRCPTMCPGSPRFRISSSWNEVQHRAGTLWIFSEWTNAWLSLIDSWGNQVSERLHTSLKMTRLDGRAGRLQEWHAGLISPWEGNILKYKESDLQGSVGL